MSWQRCLIEVLKLKGSRLLMESSDVFSSGLSGANPTIDLNSMPVGQLKYPP